MSQNSKAKKTKQTRDEEDVKSPFILYKKLTQQPQNLRMRVPRVCIKIFVQRHFDHNQSDQQIAHIILHAAFSDPFHIKKMVVTMSSVFYLLQTRGLVKAWLLWARRWAILKEHLKERELLNTLLQFEFRLGFILPGAKQ